jgi:hypothetical protein
MEFLFRLLPAKVENTLDIFMGKDGVPIWLKYYQQDEEQTNVIKHCKLAIYTT